MIDPATQAQLKDAIADCIGADRGVLDVLREEIRPLKTATRRIQPRATTSISLVGTDGGNNQLQFDPFLIQLVRVVDSSNNEYCVEAVSPTTPTKKLDAYQFNADATPRTALGEMMTYLGINSLPKLSHMIRPADAGAPVSPSWVQVYRELVEWAILFSILKKDFGTDTLIVCDGLLRSKVFAGDLFLRLMQGMKERIDAQWTRSRRRIFLAGVAKHSKVLSRYRLAMALEGVLQTDYPAYVEVPRDVEERAYVWSEFARGADRMGEGGELNKFVGGKMFLLAARRHVAAVSSAGIAETHGNDRDARLVIKNVPVHTHPGAQAFAARVVPRNAGRVHARAGRLPDHEDACRRRSAQHRARPEREMRFARAAVAHSCQQYLERAIVFLGHNAFRAIAANWTTTDKDRRYHKWAFVIRQGRRGEGRYSST